MRLVRGGSPSHRFGPGWVGLGVVQRRPDPQTDDVVAELLDRHGRTFASEAGIRLQRNTPSPLFRLLCLSLLISARIGAEVAMAAARALADAGWTTPQAMASATWEERTRVLNRAGYARYDESTSRYLAATAELLLDRYDGDLRRVRDEADGDPDEVARRLRECKGIGAVGAAVFLREVQVAWRELAPFADDRTLDSARRLGLPDSAEGLRDHVDDDDTFVRLVAALVRADLEHDHDRVLEAAGSR
jgi:endonuclease III